MRRTRLQIPIVGFLIMVAVSIGAGQGILAQSSSGQEKARSKPVVRKSLDNGSGQYKGPGIKGKMNSTTSNDRWAAAIRSADQRADQIRKDKGKGK